MSHLYAWHAAFISMDMTCICAWRIHICDMTQSHVWHDSCISVTWLIHVCGVTCSYIWYDSFKSLTWLIHMCDMTQWLVWMCNANARCDTYTRCHMHPYARRAPCVWIRHASHMRNVSHMQMWDAIHMQDAICSHMRKVSHIMDEACLPYAKFVLCARYARYHTTDGGNQPQNNYACQNSEQVFTGVPVNFKEIYMGVSTFQTSFNGSKRESPSLNWWTNRTTVRFGDSIF